MARQWVLPEGGLLLEEGTEEWLVPEGGAVNEDQVTNAVSIPALAQASRHFIGPGVS